MGRLWEAESNWVEKHGHTYVCTYIMIFEGTGAGQRYKQHSNVPRKGTAAPILQPAMLTLLEARLHCFQDGKLCQRRRPQAPWFIPEWFLWRYEEGLELQGALQKRPQEGPSPEARSSPACQASGTGHGASPHCLRPFCLSGCLGLVWCALCSPPERFSPP